MAYMCPTKALVQNMLSQCVLAELDYPTTHNYFRDKVTELQQSYLDFANMFEQYDHLFATVDDMEGAWQFTIDDIALMRDSIGILNSMLKKISEGELITPAEFEHRTLQLCGLTYKSIYGAASAGATGYFSIIYSYNSGMVVNPTIQSDPSLGVLFGDFGSVSSSGTVGTYNTKVTNETATTGILSDDAKEIAPRNFVIKPSGSNDTPVSSNDPNLQMLYVNYGGYSFPTSLTDPDDSWYPGIMADGETMRVMPDAAKGSNSYAKLRFGPKIITVYFDSVPLEVKDDDDNLLYWRFIDTKVVGVVDESPSKLKSGAYTTITGLFNTPSFTETDTFIGENMYYYLDSMDYQPTPFAFKFYDNGRVYWYKNDKGEYVEIKIRSQQEFDNASDKYDEIYVSPTDGYMPVKSGFELVKTAKEFAMYKAKYGRLFTRGYQLFLHTYDPTKDIYEEFKKQQNLGEKYLTLYKFWRGRFGNHQDPRSVDLADQRRLVHIKTYQWKPVLKEFATKFNSLVRVFDEESQEPITVDKLFENIPYQDDSAFMLLFQLGNIWAVRHELVRVYYAQIKHILQEGNHGVVLKS